jgi:hypothetical protein
MEKGYVRPTAWVARYHHNIASREAQREERGVARSYPQASRYALVQGLSMTSRILRSGLAEAITSKRL